MENVRILDTGLMIAKARPWIASMLGKAKSGVGVDPEHMW